MTMSTTYAASAIARIRQAQAAAARMPGGTTAASIERTRASRPSWRRASSHCARSRAAACPALSVAGSGAPVSPVVFSSSAAADSAVSRGVSLSLGGVSAGRPAGAGPGRVVARRWGRVGGAGRPVHGPSSGSGSVVVWPVWPTPTDPRPLRLLEDWLA